MRQFFQKTIKLGSAIALNIRRHGACKAVQHFMTGFGWPTFQIAIVPDRPLSQAGYFRLGHLAVGDDWPLPGSSISTAASGRRIPKGDGLLSARCGHWPLWRERPFCGENRPL